MAIIPITQGVDNPILRTKSEKVKKFDAKLQKLLHDMLDTVKDENGLGIAAPQVGVNSQIFWVRFNHDTPQEIYIPMINAEVFDISKEMENGEEGCLSVPGVFGIVPRHNSLTVRYTDPKKKQHTLHLHGLSARIIQHEFDHLNGILCVDKMIKKTEDGAKNKK
ncbi:MAG: peptide deformylase [Patescibacteria group bacterium]